LASSAEASKARPAALPGETIAQAGDLGPPPSPEAIVTTPPPAPLAEDALPPFPGYSWDPGHWIWDGAQYVWAPGKSIVQPTNTRGQKAGAMQRTLIKPLLQQAPTIVSARDSFLTPAEPCVLLFPQGICKQERLPKPREQHPALAGMGQPTMLIWQFRDDF
jgi:hypothetical protein